ncbi:putative GTP diphosphokinase CRSH1, chloroplastic [Porphyridium purpureum]|uniref:Putative GTP diphosphokinase CRSH1, chloroplastic n=1 Tax=Porphyridium purpureum TaxID=35688 RepID=A0A5J4YM49_PORPP|nr:putative GTP diphosphokinase CRSH1, chloroplastic [Porphyridium purpureum]|eukprot:POR7472..scf295_9
MHLESEREKQHLQLILDRVIEELDVDRGNRFAHHSYVPAHIEAQQLGVLSTAATAPQRARHLRRLLHALASISADLETMVAAMLYCAGLQAHRLQDKVPPNVRDSLAGIDELLQDKVWLDSLGSSFSDLDDSNARILREFVFSASQDPRAVVMHLVDVLVQLKNIHEVPLFQQHIFALECLQLYSPVAHSLGVGKVMWELEDLAFRVLFPSSYKSVEEWHRQIWRESSKQLETAREEFMHHLLCHQPLLSLVEGYTITSRTKNLFSTFKKMLRSNKRKEEILDVVAMRVIVRLRPDLREDASAQARACKIVYEQAVALWGAENEWPGRTKDYVSVPKGNGYQSIHTTITHPTGFTFEVQVRSEEMHMRAEHGDAGHGLYKGGGTQRDSVLRFASAIQAENIACISVQKLKW